MTAALPHEAMPAARAKPGRFARLRTLLSTTAFKIIAAYLAIFVMFAGFVIAWLGFATQRLLTDQLTETITAEVRGIAEQYSIGGIRRQVDQIVAHMLELGKKSQEIGSVLDIVSELAEQTNILAINATIEAAGAGESGKRFTVVADEKIGRAHV